MFGMKGSTYLLGASEWLFGALLLAGFWNKKLGVLGALGSVLTFLCTVTIIPFMRTAGPHRLADSLRWSETSRSS